MEKQVVTTIAEGSVFLHELYLSHVKAGFSKDQAMRLLLHTMASNSPCPHCGRTRDAATET